MTTHEERELLSAYLDGELAASDRTRIEQHLPSCAECGTTLDALRATVAEMRALPEPVPGEQDSWALRAAIARSRRAPTRWQRWAVASSSAAAAAVLIVGGLLVAGGGGASGDGAPTLATARGEMTLDYDAASAGALLDEESTALRAAAPAAVGTGQDSADRTTAFGAEADDDAGARCAPELFEDDTAPTLRRSISATFEGKPAYLLVYEADDPARLELWVVSVTDCRDVLYFARRAL